MVFLIDAAFAIALVALALGGALLYFLKVNKVHYGFCKFIAYFVVVLAFIAMACTFYYGTKYWFQGYYEKPMPTAKHELFKKYTKPMDHKMDKKYPQKEEY